MVVNSELMDPLQALLTQMHVAAQDLWELLTAEHQQLASGEIEAVGEIITRKREVVENIASLESELRQVFSAAGFQATDAISDLVQFDSQGRLASRWHELRSLMEKCQAKNQENGALVAAGLRHATQMIHLLRSLADNHDTELYQRNGHTTPEFQSNELVQA